MPVYKIFVLGLVEPVLTESQQSILKNCTTVFATRRYEKLCAANQQFNPISPLQEAITQMAADINRGNIAVFASGDPLFYGIGKTLISTFDPEMVEFYPALSAVQRAAALFKTTWDNAAILSLHGRQTDNLPQLLLGNDKTFFFTDKTNTPNVIAQKISDYFVLLNNTEALEKITISVAEDIGLPSQRIRSGKLATIADSSFSPLNICCIQHKLAEKSVDFSFGLQEAEIQHSRGLITKNEVRAATLHALRLPKKGIMWDIGAGSGSISIEAARNNPELTIFAIDYKEEEMDNVKKNIKKFGCFNISPVLTKAPWGLEALPAPDRIFVGGSGGNLEQIIVCCKDRLSPAGRIVINGVIQKTIKTAPLFLEKYGFSSSSSIISVSRKSSTNEKIVFNPITIMTGVRKTKNARNQDD